MIEKMADQHDATSHGVTTYGSMNASSTCGGNENQIYPGEAKHSAASAGQIESKAVVSRQTTKGILAIETKEISTPGKGLSLGNSAKEHVLKTLSDSHHNSFTTANMQGSNLIPSGFQTAQALSIKANDEPVLPEFFSNARGSKHNVAIEERNDIPIEFFSDARGSKHNVTIEEQNDIPIEIRFSPKQKLDKESPHSLRMLLFAEKTALSVEKDEKQKRACRHINVLDMPASDHMEAIKLSRMRQFTENDEASSGFCEHLPFSGALLYQEMTSFSKPTAYSGSFSPRSDSSTSTRSFAFPILASEWNSSPVKMHAPDSEFTSRQRSRQQLNLCCCRLPPMFEWRQ